MAKGSPRLRVTTKGPAKTKGGKESSAAASSTDRKEATAALAPMSVVDQKALGWIIAFLTDPKNRHQIAQCKGHLECGMCDTSVSRDIEQKEVFHHTYTNWKSLPKYFIAEVLVTICLYTKQLVDLIDVGGQGQLRAAFTCIFGVSDHAWWPPALHRHELLREFLKAQLPRMGNRHIKLKEAVSGTGKIDWMAAMAYTIEWKKGGAGEPDTVLSLTHVGGLKEKLSMVVITDEFTVQEPWDDMRAEFVGHPMIRPRLADFFNQNAEFKRFWSKAFFKEEADKLEKAWQERRELAKAVTNDTILHSRDAQRKEVMRAKAKARIPASKMATPLKKSST